MGTTHDLAAVALAVLTAVILPACLQAPASEANDIASRSTDQTGGPEPIGEAQQESGRVYESKEFPFRVFLKDDGKGAGGGWQVTDKVFHFVERNWGIPRYYWQCPIQIGMPLRCVALGRITPSRAALYSAEVATAVVEPLLQSRPAWENQGAAFCLQLVDRLQEEFDDNYPEVGARVKRPY